MKKFTTLLLLLTLLLSVLASCQGTVPTGSLPQTKETAPLTEGVKPPEEEKTEGQTQEDTSLDSAAFFKELQKAFSKDPDAYQKLSNDWEKELKKMASSLSNAAIPYPKDGVLTIHQSQTVQIVLLSKYGERWHTTPDHSCPIQAFFQKLAERMEEKQCYEVIFEGGSVAYSDGAFLVLEELWYYSDFGREQTAVIAGMPTRIKAKAFSDAPQLKTITLPSNACAIEPKAFEGCLALKTVSCQKSQVIPGSTDVVSSSYYTTEGNIFGTDHLAVILASGEPFSPTTRFDEESYQAMKNSHQEIAVVCPVDDVAEHFLVVDGVLVAYYGIGGHVVIPEGVTEIRGGVFDHCKGSILKVTLPSTLKKICTGAFANMPLLIDLALPDGMEEIETLAIYEDVDSIPFIHITNIPKNCKVAEYAFHDYKP